jgi:hypothetical protein
VTITLTAATFKLRGAAAQAGARLENRNARRFIAGETFSRILCVPFRIAWYQVAHEYIINDWSANADRPLADAHGSVTLSKSEPRP